MVKISPQKTSKLNMAISPKDRALIDRAAKVQELPPSVWGRAVLIKEANKILSEAKAAK